MINYVKVKLPKKTNFTDVAYIFFGNFPTKL